MRPALLPFLLAAAAARAQQPPPPPAPAELRLTQDEAVERALAEAPALVRLQALVGAADAQSDAARAQRWPHVELGAGYQRRSEVPELAIFTPTGDPTQPVERVVVFPNIQDNWRVRAGLSLPLYTGGRTRGEIESADESRAAADFDLRAGRADLVLETQTALPGYCSPTAARPSGSARRSRSASSTRAGKARVLKPGVQNLVAGEARAS